MLVWATAWVAPQSMAAMARPQANLESLFILILPMITLSAMPA
jgi:hypothetical protein